MQSSFIIYKKSDREIYVKKAAQEFTMDYLCEKLVGKQPLSAIWNLVEQTTNNNSLYDQTRGLTQNTARLSWEIIQNCAEEFHFTFGLTRTSLIAKVDAFLTEMEKEDERADTLEWINQERQCGNFDKAGYDEARRTVKDSN